MKIELHTWGEKETLDIAAYVCRRLGGEQDDGGVVENMERTVENITLLLGRLINMLAERDVLKGRDIVALVRDSVEEVFRIREEGGRTYESD